MYSKWNSSQRIIFLRTLGFHLTEVVRGIDVIRNLRAYRTANEVMHRLWAHMGRELQLGVSAGYPAKVFMGVLTETVENGGILIG